MRYHPSDAGFTLVEVLMVVLTVAVLAAIVVPMMNPNIHDRLQTAAQTVASDMAYGRSLAVTNNDSYTFTFNVASNQYSLQYAGSNPALATLPLIAVLLGRGYAPEPGDQSGQPAHGGRTRAIVCRGDRRLRARPDDADHLRKIRPDDSGGGNRHLADRRHGQFATLHHGSREPGDRAGFDRKLSGQPSSGGDCDG